MRTGDAPDMDGVGHVAEVEVTGRARGETRHGPGRYVAIRRLPPGSEFRSTSRRADGRRETRNARPPKCGG